MDLIVIAGSPGVGKSTLGRALSQSLGSPFLEFSVLREPHLDATWSNASPVEHEMAWESFQFVVRNYMKYGYRNVVITDLRDERVRQVPETFADLEYRIVTLTLADEAELRRRVGARRDGFVDADAAVAWNAAVRTRPGLPRETKIEADGRTVEELLETVRSSAPEASSRRYPRGIGPSLAVLGAVVGLALLGLLWSGNWPKAVRVMLAAATYAAVLLLLSRGRRTLRLVSFMGAGAAAGVVNGLVRPLTTPALIAASTLGAALLIGPLHWWALRTWRRTGHESP